MNHNSTEIAYRLWCNDYEFKQQGKVFPPTHPIQSNPIHWWSQSTSNCASISNWPS